jgi:hypothetical protein
MSKNYKNLVIVLKKKYLLVFISNQLILKQFYIKNKVYTLFFILHLLYKFGVLNKTYN